MKKVIVTGIVIVLFAVYAVFYRQSSSAIQTLPNTANTTSSSSQTKPTSSGKSGQYKNGVYTGSAADAYYGTIQVKTTITNGQLSDVEFLQYPNDQQESIEVNDAAMPILKQEAIQAQNANVDIVSGATQTSQAFKESLASALSQAK